MSCTPRLWNCGCETVKWTECPLLGDLLSTLAGARPPRIAYPDAELTALALDDHWIDYFEVNPYPIAINDRALPPHLRSWLSDRDLRLVVPLVARARLVGLLAVGGATSSQSPADDYLFLITLADEAAAAIRLAEMCHAQAEPVGAERELQAATAAAVHGRR